MQYIDSIKKVQRFHTLPNSPHRKFRWWLLICLLAVFSIMILASTYGVKAIKGKLDALRLFQNGKYLVLFQNNAEMRPTGGFIGSFAIIEFSNYKIKNINFNTNIYKLDQVFTSEHFITPPEPLKTISGGKWSLRDSNFAVSYPEAAQKIQWFYEEESGEKIDGVIAINASVIQNILKITGPIAMPKYDTTITANNFYRELANKIEKEYFLDPTNVEINEPKSILKEMMPEILNKAMDFSKIQLGQLLYKEIERKQILFYSKDSGIEKAILGENWGGEVQFTSGDYLYINNANIAEEIAGDIVGGKSSLNVKEEIAYKILEKDNLLIANLKLTRSHAGTYTWPDGVNRNFSRVLVPDGTVLKDAQLNGRDFLPQVQTAKEAGKAVFSFWTQTSPGTSNIVNLTYALPISSKNYSLLVQKQPGNLGDNLTVNFEGKLLFDGILDTDKEVKT